MSDKTQKSNTGNTGGSDLEVYKAITKLLKFNIEKKEKEEELKKRQTELENNIIFELATRGERVATINGLCTVKIKLEIENENPQKK